jgi:hypothetical protein
MIAGRIFISFGQEIFVRFRIPEFFAIFPHFRDSVGRRKVRSLSQFFVSFFRILLIKNHVFFVSLIDATYAIFAGLAVDQKRVVGALRAVLGIN